MNRIDGLLRPVFRQLGLEGALTLRDLERQWDTLFPPPLSLHLRPIRLRDGELLITVDSSVWLQQVSLYKDEISGRLRPFGVADVRFRLGRVSTGERRRKPREEKAMPPLGPEDQQRIEESTAGIKDTALRESIRRAMGKALPHSKA